MALYPVTTKLNIIQLSNHCQVFRDRGAMNTIAPPYSAELVQLFLLLVENDKILGRCACLYGLEEKRLFWSDYTKWITPVY